MGRSMTPDIIFFNWAVINFSQIFRHCYTLHAMGQQTKYFPCQLHCFISFFHGSSWSTFLISCQKVLPAVKGLGAVFLMFIQTSLNCRRSSHRSHAGARPPVESVLASPLPHPQLSRGHQLKAQLPSWAEDTSWAEATSWKPSPPVERSYRKWFYLGKFFMGYSWQTFKSPLPGVIHGRRISHLSHGSFMGDM